MEDKLNETTPLEKLTNSEQRSFLKTMKRLANSETASSASEKRSQPMT